MCLCFAEEEPNQASLGLFPPSTEILPVPVSYLKLSYPYLSLGPFYLPPSFLSTGGGDGLLGRKLSFCF